MLLQQQRQLGHLLLIVHHATVPVRHLTPQLMHAHVHVCWHMTAVSMCLLQVRYPASLPTLPMGVSGNHFVTIAGTHQSSLEALLLKRGLRGPGWCLLTGATRKDSSAQVSKNAEMSGTIPTSPC
jgi:hypothetical protein